MTPQLKQHHLDLLNKYGLLDHQSVCEVQQFKSGETIFSQGVEYKYIMIVVSGKAKVCTSAPSGKDLVLAYYLSSGLIGDVELMSNTTYATASGHYPFPLSKSLSFHFKMIRIRFLKI